MSQNNLFHPGELYFQAKIGALEQVAEFAPRLLVNHLSTQHQEFFSQLNMIFVASVDQDGTPWASVLSGNPGFIKVIDATHFSIDLNILKNDQLNDNLSIAGNFGFLGLQFQTRRRNRISARLIKKHLATLYFKVELAFGNCPKYIQSRKINKFKITNSHSQCVEINQFDEVAQRMISHAHTFFIASYYPTVGQQGCDISHRGGRPGFVTVVDNETLSFDDYDGNNVFMTLGNLVRNPVAGLLFIDFESGELLQISCSSEIVDFPLNKCQRRVRLYLEKGYYYKSALSVESEFIEYSPYLPT